MLKYSIIQRNKSQGSKTWYLRTFDTDSKQISFSSLGTEKKADAVLLLAKKNAERFKTTEQLLLENSPLIEEVVNSWLNLTSKGNKNTYNAYKSKIPLLLDYCKKNNINKLNEFTAKNASELIEKVPNTNNSRTILLYKRVYTAFFNYAYSKYGIEKNCPFKRVKTPKIIRKEREFWTIEQIEQILNNAKDKYERLFWAFMAFAGLRFFESAEMTWEQIKEGKITLMGKGAKLAKIPISQKLLNELELFKNNTPIEHKGQIFPKFYNHLENAKIKKICENLGIEGLANCHKFRHSFASNLLRAGGSIIAVSKLMRHETPDITLKVYSHCLPDDLDKTLNLL